MFNITEIRITADEMDKYRDHYIDAELRTVPYRLTRIAEIDRMLAEEGAGIIIPGYGHSEINRDKLRAERKAHADALMRIGEALDQLPEPDQDLVVGYYLKRLSADFLAGTNGKEKKFVLRRLRKIRNELDL